MIETIKSTDPRKAAISLANQKSKRRPRVNLEWDDIRGTYNDASIRDAVLIQSDKVSKLANVVTVLTRRGLQRGEDYELARTVVPNIGKRVTITRLSTKEMG